MKWREVASISKQEFCLQLIALDLMTNDDVITAAENGWPSALDNMLTGMAPVDAAQARVIWATSPRVRRNHPLLSAIAGHLSVSDPQLDAMFGWPPE